MFILLKLLLVLFRPLTWIVLLFLLAAFSRTEKWKKLGFRGGLIALLFFTNPFIIRTIISAYETPPASLPAGKQFGAGILLGGFISYDADDKTGYFNQAADRFIQTALLYKRGQIKRIIVSAGNGYITENTFREADFVKQRLTELGVPATDILTDAASRNTEENAIYTKRIIDSLQLQPPLLLISSAMHLPRAQQVFQKKGMNVVLYPADFSAKGAGNNLLEDYLLPSSMALVQWNNCIKEWVGRFTYRLTGKG